MPATADRAFGAREGRQRKEASANITLLVCVFRPRELVIYKDRPVRDWYALPQVPLKSKITPIYGLKDMDPKNQSTLATRFRALHQPGNPLVLANTYSASTAVAVASHSNAKAIATASYAIAASTYAIADDDMTLIHNLSAITPIAAAVHPTGLPLTLDLQDGYDDPAETIRQAIRLGAVGANIEDTNCKSGTLRTLDDAVARIRAAVSATKEAGVPDFCVNARTDALCFGLPLSEAIERGKAFLAAGACTVFVWGGARGRGVSMAEVSELVRALEGRLNVKMVLKPGFAGVNELSEAGVARISVGPELYHRAVRAYKEAADEILGE